MTERESYHAQPRAVDAIGYVVPISTEMLLEAEATRSAMQRWMSATPEERAEWAAEQGRKRAEERAAAERMPLTLDALIDKLGWSREYAEHFAQPYCYCEDGRDGWEYCPHARDEGLTP